MANALVVGLALIAVALGAILVPRAWEEWSEAALGLWAIASPWVLDFAGHYDARLVAVATGAVILALALWTLATDKEYGGWLLRHDALTDGTPRGERAAAGRPSRSRTAAGPVPFEHRREQWGPACALRGARPAPQGRR